MNTTEQTTTTEIIPTRITCDHYQTPSFTETDKVYDQHLDYDLKRWICNCPDASYRKNINCKHIILLRAFIKKERAQQAPQPEQHSTSVELVQTLARIARLEQAQDTTNGTIENLDHALCIKSDQIAMMQTRIGAYDQLQKQISILQDKSYAQDAEAEEQELLLKQQQITINRQSQQIEQLMEVVRTLQTDVCRLNERTNNQQKQLDDQAQQKASEQVVRVVVEQTAPAPRQPQQACQERQPATETVTRVSKSECKVGKFTVGVVGNCAAGCSCSIGKTGKQCGHMVDVDKFLSK